MLQYNKQIKLPRDIQFDVSPECATILSKRCPIWWETLKSNMTWLDLLNIDNVDNFIDIGDNSRCIVGECFNFTDDYVDPNSKAYSSEYDQFSIVIFEQIEMMSRATRHLFYASARFAYRNILKTLEDLSKRLQSND